ncbi:lysostaphin resistance A-like protein [Peribacillus sp. B-H-3]|uniref:CPBP family intramembrane glutamic endopeptidase n=1 Tax=Peribacillus sp. B-H-3 TaxID=3400420 RepID=UPI003B027F5D
MKNKQAELIKQLSDKQLIYNLFITQLILLAAALLLGLFLFPDIASFTALFRISDINIAVIGLPAGAAVVAFDIIMMKTIPASWQDDGGVNERIFKSLSYPLVPAAALIVAFCEEVLFRGVIQTNIGLVWTSVIFALVHYRYLFKWYLLVNIAGLSFFIGWIYSVTGNLMVTITAHFIIDFILGIILKNKQGKA